jgi:hypothetical protein
VAWRCPWCHARSLHLFRAGTPWATLIGHDVVIVTDTDWFRCAKCGAEGTWQYLAMTMRHEPRHSVLHGTDLVVRKGHRLFDNSNAVMDVKARARNARTRERRRRKEAEL